MRPEEHAGHDYAEITHEVSVFHDQYKFAEHLGDAEAAAEAERKMNESLDELNDVLRALGRTATDDRAS